MVLLLPPPCTANIHFNTSVWINNPFVFMNDECVLSTCVSPNFTAWTVR